MHGDMGLCIGVWHYGFMHGGGFMYGDMGLCMVIRVFMHGDCRK